MHELVGLPGWLGTAAIGAVLAAVGYVAKLVIELVTASRRERRGLRAALVRLGSLLRAARVAFEVQNELVDRLLKAIQQNHPEIVTDGGYERSISRAFQALTDDEREMHAIVRGYTTNALRPTNEKLLEWVRGDTYFKARKRRGNLEKDLALKLAILEAHLLLWLAKYEAWIPNEPQHALVYLADEQEHGLRFPSSLDQTVAQLLSRF